MSSGCSNCGRIISDSETFDSLIRLDRLGDELVIVWGDEYKSSNVYICLRCSSRLSGGRSNPNGMTEGYAITNMNRNVDERTALYFTRGDAEASLPQSMKQMQIEIEKNREFGVTGSVTDKAFLRRVLEHFMRWEIVPGIMAELAPGVIGVRDMETDETGFYFDMSKWEGLRTPRPNGPTIDHRFSERRMSPPPVRGTGIGYVSTNGEYSLKKILKCARKEWIKSKCGLEWHEAPIIILLPLSCNKDELTFKAIGRLYAGCSTALMKLAK